MGRDTEREATRLNDPAPITPARAMFDAVLRALPADLAVLPNELDVPFTPHEVRAVLRAMAREGQVEIVSTNLGRKYKRRKAEN